MDDLSLQVRKVTRISLFFLSICFLAWALLPKYEAVLAGIVIGCCAGIINQLHLGWKVSRIADAAAQGRKSRAPLGFFTRAAIAVLAVVIATQYFHFSLIATIIGLFIPQLATLILGILSVCSSKS